MTVPLRRPNPSCSAGYLDGQAIEGDDRRSGRRHTARPTGLASLRRPTRKCRIRSIKSSNLVVAAAWGRADLTSKRSKRAARIGIRRGPPVSTGIQVRIEILSSAIELRCLHPNAIGRATLRIDQNACRYAQCAVTHLERGRSRASPLPYSPRGSSQRPRHRSKR